MLIVKNKKESEPVKKKSKYADGISASKFKLNGVKKLLIVSILPHVQETYPNLMLMLNELDLSGIDMTLCADIKLLLTFEGKQAASCTHNCTICDGKSPWLEKAKLMTVGDLKNYFKEFVAAGSKKIDAALFKNVVNDPLVAAPDETLLINLVGLPELHILTGICGKGMEVVEKRVKATGQNGEEFVKYFLKQEGIRRSEQRGGKTFEGMDIGFDCFKSCDWSVVTFFTHKRSYCLQLSISCLILR